MKKIFFIICLFLISACSVHKATTYNKATYSDLAHIGLDKVNGKRPLFIRQVFQDEFYINAQDINKSKKYALYLKITDSIGDWLIQSDSTILRKNLRLSVHFSLKKLSTNKIVTSGSAQSLIIFSESPSAWSSYISSEKAYKNAVRDAMRLVRIKIVAFLAKQKYTKKNENQSKQHQKVSK